MICSLGLLLFFFFCKGDDSLIIFYFTDPFAFGGNLSCPPRWVKNWLKEALGGWCLESEMKIPIGCKGSKMIIFVEVCRITSRVGVLGIQSSLVIVI